MKLKNRTKELACFGIRNQNTGVVGSNQARFTKAALFMRKAKGNHPIKSTSLEKARRFLLSSELGMLRR